MPTPTKKTAPSSPIPWVILIVITLGIIAFKIIPKYTEWNDKKSEIKTAEQTIEKLKTEIKTNEELNRNIKIQFEEAAKPHLEAQKQLFPTTIDITKSARIIELYSLQSNILDTNTDHTFELKNLNFSKSRQNKEVTHNFSDITLDFQTDKESLEEFIEFIQKGTLPKRFTDALENPDTTTDIADLNFLQENTLPIAHIQTLSIKEKDGIIDTKIQIRFFSQLAQK